MVRRDAVPLFKTRHVALVEALQEIDNSDKKIAVHLALGTGARVDTICHTHSSWFEYGERKNSDTLYYRIKADEPCRKYGNTEPCGDCNNLGHSEFEPKTPAGDGRRLMLHNTWTNPVTGEEEYFGLQDACESYFQITGQRAPDGIQHGNEMIDANGVSKGHFNDWLRDVAAKSTITAGARRDWLRECIELEEADPDDPDKRSVEQIVDFGTDEAGNEIPDIFAHDLRATYCTHLMRNDVTRHKAINKTGHKKPEAMSTYVNFAEREIDSAEESGFY
jgi:hypothetical protein